MINPLSAPPGRLPVIPPLLAQAIRPLPILPLQLALAGFLRRLCRRNPHLFDRLGEHAHKRFGIKPTDLPLAFVIEASPPNPSLSVVRALPIGLDARISCSLANLLGMLEGRIDGDALMFQRQLIIEGDMEAVLALRNTIDDAGIDLVAEIAGLAGPLRGPMSSILGAARDRVVGASPMPEERR